MAFEEDFCLLGVAADEPDYKLCWMVNQALDMNFEKQEDLVLFHKKLDADQSFSLFHFKDEDALVTYRIIKNRSSHGFFLDELKNLDFLIHIQGEISTNQVDKFMRSLGILPSIRMSVPVDLTRIKNMERLLLW